MKAGTDEWSVRYTGDPHMTGSTVRDLTLLACADLATAAGYNWFVITEKVDESGSITEGTSFSGPATTQTSSGYSGGVDKLSGTMSSQTRFISQFRYEIRCFQEKPDIPGALESGPIRKELLEKYSLSGPGGGAQVSK